MQIAMKSFWGYLIFATRLQKILHTFALANEQNWKATDTCRIMIKKEHQQISIWTKRNY